MQDPKKTLQPFLKWAGGKRWLVPHLQTIWSKYSDHTLVEPFCGGLAIALGLNPKKAILNDSNPHLINLYNCIKDCQLSPPGIPLENDREVYDSNRALFNHLTTEFPTRLNCHQRAWLFYFLNRTGFNGLCRFNLKGEYNVPFGKHKKINYLTDFSPYVAAFKEWDFYSFDFALLEIPADGFIYVDPPYDAGFTKYEKKDFKWEDQIRLARWLSEQSVPVVASNLATERILDLYGSYGFQIQQISARRRISCNGDRAPVMEMLATLNVEVD